MPSSCTLVVRCCTSWRSSSVLQVNHLSMFCKPTHLQKEMTAKTSKNKTQTAPRAQIRMATRQAATRKNPTHSFTPALWRREYLFECTGASPKKIKEQEKEHINPTEIQKAEIAARSGMGAFRASLEAVFSLNHRCPAISWHFHSQLSTAAPCQAELGNRKSRHRRHRSLCGSSSTQSEKRRQQFLQLLLPVFCKLCHDFHELTVGQSRGQIHLLQQCSSVL